MLERQCRENAEHTVTLSQDEVELLFRLSREAETRERESGRLAQALHEGAQEEPLAIRGRIAP